MFFHPGTQVPCIFLSTFLHVPSRSFLRVLLARCFPLLFHSACLPVPLKVLYLEFGFRVSPLQIAQPAINFHQCISVHCLAHDVSSSSYFFLPCLHFLSCFFSLFCKHVDVVFLSFSLFLVYLIFYSSLTGNQ